ncbi:MAG TPA: NAD(P)/FAD-dependent oxidoreductase [Candidatus Dormibacteraeota bacterium]|nr:NAD(P)/FAD-dependent oxidoreductase [Candidatus Dormibacteraeota bacterium]
MAGERPTVVVIGAGFGGLTLARRLRRAPVRVILVDRNNYHLFTPLLYQVASALLDPGEIAQPVRKLIAGIGNCEFRQATVESFDLDRRRVHTDRGDLEYDHLVLAPGSSTNYFGNASLTSESFGLKKLPEGIALRNRVIDCFERARWEGSAEARRRLLSFAVIGGGPTGVEYTGALTEFIHLAVRRDYPGMNPDEPRVTLIEAAPHLLGGFDGSLADAAVQALMAKGAQVRLGAMVKGVDEGVVTLQDGSTLPAGTVVWTAGVEAAELARDLEIGHGRQGRIEVEPTLQLRGRPEVLAIGDACALDGLPMLIPVAMQQAKHAATVIRDMVAGRSPGPFRYHDPGIMATIGRNQGVAQIGRLRLKGLFGWGAWLVVHLVNVVTFRARAMVLINWAQEYLFYDRPVRILVRPEDDTRIEPLDQVAAAAEKRRDD